MSFEIEPASPVAGFFMDERHDANDQYAIFAFYGFSTASGQPAPRAQVRVTADNMSSLSTTLSLSADATRSLYVIPYFSSISPVGAGTRQTFAVVDGLNPSSGVAQPVRSAAWHLWTNGAPNPNERPVDGTMEFSTGGHGRVYAKDNETGQWASADYWTDVVAGSASVEVRPSVATVAPNGVVQFTAFTSTGASVTWQTYDGTVNSSGQYTAPSTPGVYGVVAVAQGSRQGVAVATVIVQ